MSESGNWKRGRRGFSQVEILVAGAITVLVAGAVTELGGLSSRLLRGNVAYAEAHAQSEHTLYWMARDIRAARGVPAPSVLTGYAPVLVLQMPRYDATGRMVTPLQDGIRVTYSVSSDGTTIVRSESSGGSRTVAEVTGGGSLSLAYNTVTADANANGIIESSEYISIAPRIRVTLPNGVGSGCEHVESRLQQEVKLRNR